MATEILGAGLSGLTAAINLALEGHEVVVHEKRGSVGAHTHMNYQGLLRTKGDIAGYLKSWNLELKFHNMPLTKAILCTRNRDIRDVTLTEPIDFVRRGGKESLEDGLYIQAKALGVKFKFNTQLKHARIMATGRSRCDMAAYGAIYEGIDYPDDTFLYMHDDRYSPRGWYLYVTPFPGGLVKVVNCTSQPYVKQTKMLYYKALKERKILADLIGDKKPVSTFGGFGGAYFPKSAVIANRLYIGEAAGFQDPFRGFGMNYALESGYLAAQAILKEQDYDVLWKKHFEKQIKSDLYRRYAMLTFGDRAIEHAFRNIKDGDTTNINKTNPSGWKGKLLKESFYRLELFHHARTGMW